ncbi:MAG: HAD family hydrolase [Candidatus Bipolaricaulota bacterium]
MTVSFDLDGLLVRNFFIDHVFPRLLNRYQGKLQKVDLNSLDDLLNQLQKLHEQKLKGDDPVAAFNWDRLVADLFDTHPTTQTPFTNALQYMLERARPRPYPEVPSVLDKLSSLDELNMVVLTNGFVRYQKPILASCNLLKHFSRVYGPDRTGVVKPSPRAFRYVQKRERDYCLHVGDRLETDIKGAQEAGLDSWLVQRHSNLPRGKHLDSSQEEERERIMELIGEITPRYLSSSLKPAVKIIGNLRKTLNL